MAFSRDVKEAALVASARHCCVCHRAKGVKVEVHHIEPAAAGGSDSADNAIVLCFDCHADAGHYNPNHPRGTRFSPSELRRHRDEWHSIVRKNRIPEAQVASPLHVRHLFCKTTQSFRALVAGDRSALPFDYGVMFFRTEVSDFFEAMLPARGKDRSPSWFGESFTTREACREKFGAVADEASGRWLGERGVGREELLELGDRATRYLIEGGMRPEDVAHARLYFERCGEDHFQEIFLLRPLRFGVLLIRNLGDRAVRLNGLTGRRIAPPEESSVRAVPALGGASLSLLLPRTTLLPGEAIAVPEAVLADPLNLDPEAVLVEGELKYPYGRYGDGCVFEGGHELWAPGAAQRFAALGPQLSVDSIEYSVPGEGSASVSVHALDPANVFALNSFYEVGCCPHLFWHTGDGWSYAGPVLEKACGIISREVIEIPSGAKGFALAELEDEVTELLAVRVQEGEREWEATSNRSLAPGEQVVCALRSESGVRRLVIDGGYFPARARSVSAEGVHRRIKAASAHLRRLAAQTQLPRCASAPGVPATVEELRSTMRASVEGS